MQVETAVLLTDIVGEAAHPLGGEIDDYNPLMELIGEASLVLIGEASHAAIPFRCSSGDGRCCRGLKSNSLAPRELSVHRLRRRNLRNLC